MDNLDMNRIPEHIAIIMDGNGRWATERGKNRSYGHQAGVDAVRCITSELFRWVLENLNYWVVTLFMAIESSFIPFPSEVVVPLPPLPERQYIFT